MCKTHGEGKRREKRGEGASWLSFNGGREGVWEGDLTSVSTCRQVRIILEDSGSCSFPRNGTGDISKLSKLPEQVTRRKSLRTDPSVAVTFGPMKEGLLTVG